MRPRHPLDDSVAALGLQRLRFIVLFAVCLFVTGAGVLTFIVLLMADMVGLGGAVLVLIATLIAVAAPVTVALASRETHFGAPADRLRLKAEVAQAEAVHLRVYGRRLTYADVLRRGTERRTYTVALATIFGGAATLFLWGIVLTVYVVATYPI